MRTQISQWGNSLAIRIPSALARSRGLESGSTVELIECEDGTVQMRPEGPTLPELLARVTPENIHEEFSFGAPLGKEML